MLQFNGLQREKCARERSQDEINRQTHVTCRLRRWLRQTTHLQSMCVLILHDTNNTNIFLLYEKLSKLKSYTRIYVEECMQHRYDVHFYLKNKNSTENKRKSDWNRNRYTTKTKKKTRINTREEEERRKKTVVFVIWNNLTICYLGFLFWCVLCRLGVSSSQRMCKCRKAVYAGQIQYIFDWIFFEWALLVDKFMLNILFVLNSRWFVSI